MAIIFSYFFILFSSSSTRASNFSIGSLYRKKKYFTVVYYMMAFITDAIDGLMQHEKMANEARRELYSVQEAAMVAEMARAMRSKETCDITETRRLMAQVKELKAVIADKDARIAALAAAKGTIGTDALQASDLERIRDAVRKLGKTTIRYKRESSGSDLDELDIIDSNMVMQRFMKAVCGNVGDFDVCIDNIKKELNKLIAMTKT